MFDEFRKNWKILKNVKRREKNGVRRSLPKNYTLTDL